MKKLYSAVIALLIFTGFAEAKMIPYAPTLIWINLQRDLGPVTLNDACNTQQYLSQRDYTYNVNSLKNAPSGQMIGGAFFSGPIQREVVAMWEQRLNTPSTCMASGQGTVFFGRYYGFSIITNGLTYYGWLEVNNGLVACFIEDVAGFSAVVGDRVGVQGYPITNIQISGSVYLDKNLNSIFDAGDVAVANQTITLQGTTYTTQSQVDGSYSLWVPGSFSSSLNLVLSTSATKIKVNPSSGLRLISFPRSTSITGQNFILNEKNVPIEPTGQVQVFVNENIQHRRCFRSKTDIQVVNNSNNALTNVPLSLEIPQYVELISSMPNYTSMSGKNANYVIPTIAANSRATITLVDSVICGNEGIRGLSQCYRATVNIPSQGSDIFPYYECRETDHLFKLVNKGAAEMADSVSYKVYLNNQFLETRKYKTIAQDTFYIQIPNDGRSVRLEVNQEASNIRTNVRYVIAEGCGTAVTWDKGFANQLVMGNEVYFSGTGCFTVVDSYDPNELIATPEGWGANHNIQPAGPITYHIGFQNTGSADAISVVLVDTLSASLDPSSISVLYSTHAYRLENTPLLDGRFRFTVVYSGINLPPSSVNEPGSHGYIEFSIKPKSTTPIETRIDNQAFIFFDYNSSIATNAVFQTLSNDTETLTGLVVNVKSTGATFDVQDQTLTYGDSPTNPDLTTNAGEEGLAATSLNEDIVTFESGKLVIHKAGSATINYNHIGNNRYLAVEGTKSRTVTVEKAPLAINAVSVEREVGTTNPLFDWIASGFVYNEDESALQGNPAINCSADESSVIGDYPILITAGTLSSENYEFSYTSANLKVVQTTGIRNDVLSNVRIYPVPSNNGKLTVEVPYEKLDRITLTNALGETEVFYQGEIESKLQGILLMKVYTDNGVYNAKVELSH